MKVIVGAGGLIAENSRSPKTELYAKNTGVPWGFYATCIDVYWFTWK